MAENKDIDATIRAIDGDAAALTTQSEEYVPQYRVVGDTKIPVSKATGSFWHARQKECIAWNEKYDVNTRWSQVLAYYQNDQGAAPNRRGNLSRVSTGRDSERKFGAENIVFGNVSALVPSIYAKNPDVEITDNSAVAEGDETMARRAKMFELLIDKLFTMKVAPGINLKPKARRLTILTMLTNIAFLAIDYTKKEQSSEVTLQEITRLSEQLEHAKTTTELQEIEGQLAALEQQINFLSVSGPSISLKRPEEVLIDSACDDINDLSKASFIMYADYIKTTVLQATYGTKNENDEWVSVYEPTHVLVPKSSNDITGQDDEITSFTLLGDDYDDYKKYGYNSREEFDDASRTKVWYVWDKTTRRVLMFSDKSWTWPIWVWDDPLNLSRFFPIFSLQFYSDPSDRYGKSEVMYYLDQQDELNAIADERSRMRHWISTKVFYDKAADVDDTKLKDFLQGNNNDFVMGINLGEGRKIGDVVGTLAPPSTAFEKLFDPMPILQSINRLSSVTPVLQNEQFKTNTTNKAIETYESSTQTRLDEKIDAIEELLGDVGLALLELCVQFMDEATVVSLIGQQAVTNGGGWKNMSVADLHESFTFSIVGGSTLKPTSKVKKEQAINLGQVLGQFAQASPAVVIVLLRVLERAFNDDFIITPDDWKMIVQGMMGAIQSETGEASPSGEGEKEDAVLDQAMAEIEQLFNNLDEQTRIEVAQAIAQGVPLKEIVNNLVSMVEGGQQQQPAAQ